MEKRGGEEEEREEFIVWRTGEEMNVGESFSFP